MNILKKFKEIIFKKAVQYTMASYYGHPKWKTSKDSEYIRQAYYKIVWVYACVSLIANATSSVEWCLYRKSNNKLLEIEEHPILNLINNQVNNYTSSKDFFEIWTTYLALQGKFYALYNSPVFPTEIEFLYPHYVYPIPNLENFIQGFEYRIEGNKKVYDEEQVLWSKFFDPLDSYDGLSPIKAMARTVDTENEAVDWNKNALQNSAVLPGAFQVVNPSPELQTTLREEWLKRYAGNKNARIPLILNAEKANYVNFGMSPQDMDFLNQRKLNRIEICTGFNVPSQLVGDPEGQTYANYEQAQRSFWENTLLPKYITTIQNELNRDLVSRFADNLLVKPDLDKIPALQENRQVKITNTRGLWKDGIIKRSEAREELGYDYQKEDEIYIHDLEEIKKEDEKTKKDKDKTNKIIELRKKEEVKKVSSL